MFRHAGIPASKPVGAGEAGASGGSVNPAVRVIGTQDFGLAWLATGWKHGRRMSMMFSRSCGVAAALAMVMLPAILQAADEGIEHITALTEKKGLPITLKGSESITTRASFKPPIEFTVVAKTDSTNIRIGYAATQVIFNWEVIPTELRVDGGPVGSVNKPGAGSIPTNKYVNLRFVVTPGKQSIFVDDQLRFEQEGDFSKVDNPISVRSMQSRVTVKSIRVKTPKETQ